MSQRKKPLIDLLLVIDFEASCWWQTKDSSSRPEIIEIGYCLIDQIKAIIVQSGQILVLPDNHDISAFSTSIHGYTIDDLLGQPSLEKAFAQLHTLIGRSLKHIPWASYGDYDREQLMRECKRKGIEYPLSRSHLNIKTLYSLITRQSGLVGLEVALGQQSMAFQGVAHKGVDDAKNTALLLFKILNRPISSGSSEAVRLIEPSPDSELTKTRVLAAQGTSKGTVVFSIVPAIPNQPPVSEQFKLLIELIRPDKIRMTGLLAFALELDPYAPMWSNQPVDIILG